MSLVAAPSLRHIPPPHPDERMLTMNLLDPDAEFDAEMPLELALRQSWSRIGAPPTLPEVPPVRVPDTVCGWRFLVKGWAHLGDTQLTALGLGKATPIRVLDRGEPLSPFGGRDQLGAQCAGASAMGSGSRATTSVTGPMARTSQSFTPPGTASNAVWGE